MKVSRLTRNMAVITLLASAVPPALIGQIYEREYIRLGGRTVAIEARSITVTANPPSVALTAGQTQQFTATISGSTRGVQWSLNPGDPGSVNSSGLYTAPASIATPLTATVVATSAETSLATGRATVTLLPGTGLRA